METIGKDGNANPGGGIFESFDLPSGPNVRADSYGYSGYETNPLFDSLIAKIITYSSEDNYKQACKRNYRSLCEFKIKGVPTNIEILKNLFVNKEFLNNKVHTNFFENNLTSKDIVVFSWARDRIVKDRNAKLVREPDQKKLQILPLKIL